MNKTTKSTSKTPLRPPAWLVKQIERQHHSEKPIAANASPTRQQGTWLGYQMRELYHALETAGGNPVAFNDGRKYVSAELAKVAFMPRKDAVEFLRGALAGLTNAVPLRGDPTTDQINRILSCQWDRLQACRTRREIVDCIKSYLPQNTIALLTKNEAAAFAFTKRIEQLCRRIGLSPARRGRPAQ